MGMGLIPLVSGAANRGASEGPFVDCHLHCFGGRSDPRFPYHRRAPYQPADIASPEHLLDCMNGAGVGHAVVVHPEPYQDDHRYLRHCLEVGEGRLKGTCLFFADRPGSLDQLPELARSLPLIAVRVHAYAPDRLPPFERPELRRLWRLATDLGLAVQLHFEPRYAARFEPLLREFAQTRVIVDHLGRPFQGTPEEHETVIRWADKFPKVIMKLSAIPSERNYPHRDIQPIIERLVRQFGVARCIIGGGFSAAASGGSYRAAFERTRGYLPFITRDEQDAILGGNARKLFFA